MDIRTKGLNHLCFPTYYRGPFVASNIANMYCTECIIGIIQNRTQELPLGSASPVLGVMREGLNHLCFPTYYRGPFVASNIANMYCTECIIGIIQNAGTPSRLRFARTRRDEGGIEPPVRRKGSRPLAWLDGMVDESVRDLGVHHPRTRRPVDRLQNSHHGYTDKGRVERGIEQPVLSYILQKPIRSVQILRICIVQNVL